MKIERTTTGVIIHGASTELKRKVLQYFSLKQPVREYFIYSGNDRTKKPLFGKEHDVIYISSGFLKIDDPVIKKLPKPTTINYPTPKKVTVEMNREPRSPLQEDCIKKMLTSDSPKITLELKPGVGKTFIATYATSKLGLKPLVVAPTTLLKNQWVEEFVGCGIPKEDIATKIWDAPNKKMCVVTISAIELELGKDWESLMKVINESSFGIKIVDEAHLHLKGMLRLDAICNIKHNWYLSATLGRSDIQEDDILNRALLDADRFVGNATYEEYQTEYINVVFQDVHYYPSNKLCQDYFKYGTHGLIKATYYNMLKHYKDGVPLIENIITIAKRARNMIDYGSMIMIIPLLDIIDKVKEAMDKDPYFSKYSYGSVDGSMNLSEKSEVLKRDIILSTMASVGTGVDVKGLSILINFDAFKSPITAEQCVGRLRRRKDDKECYYVDVRDHVKQARTITNWVSSRRFLLEYFPGIKPNMKQFPDIRK